MCETERPLLMPYRGAFDGFHAVSASVSKTCLVRFDKKKYSVAASAVEAACAEALDAGIVSADVILNALARRTQPATARIAAHWASRLNELLP